MAKIQKNKKFILILLGIGLIGGLVVFAMNQRTKPVTNTTEKPNETLKAMDAQSSKEVPASAKDRILQDQQKTPTPVGPKTVKPLITFAEQVGDNIEAVAYVTGVSEEGGSCTLTATHGDQTVSKTVSASQNSSTTDCRAFLIARDQFPSSGDWEIKISYKSDSASGTSDPWQITLK